MNLPLVKRGAGGGAVLVGLWLLSASLLLPLDDPRMATTSVADSYREMMMMIGVLAKVREGEMTSRIFAMDNRSFYKPNLD